MSTIKNRKDLSFNEKFKAPLISARQFIVFAMTLFGNVLGWLGAPLFGFSFNVQYFIFMFITTLSSYIIIMILRGVEPAVEPPERTALVSLMFKSLADLVFDFNKVPNDIKPNFDYAGMTKRFLVWGLRQWNLLEDGIDVKELTQLKEYIDKLFEKKDAKK